MEPFTPQSFINQPNSQVIQPVFDFYTVQYDEKSVKTRLSSLQNLTDVRTKFKIREQLVFLVQEGSSQIFDQKNEQNILIGTHFSQSKKILTTLFVPKVIEQPQQQQYQIRINQDPKLLYFSINDSLFLDQLRKNTEFIQLIQDTNFKFMWDESTELPEEDESFTSLCQLCENQQQKQLYIKIATKFYVQINFNNNLIGCNLDINQNCKQFRESFQLETLNPSEYVFMFDDANELALEDEDSILIHELLNQQNNILNLSAPNYKLKQQTSDFQNNFEETKSLQNQEIHIQTSVSQPSSNPCMKKKDLNNNSKEQAYVGYEEKKSQIEESNQDSDIYKMFDIDQSSMPVCSEKQVMRLLVRCGCILYPTLAQQNISQDFNFNFSDEINILKNLLEKEESYTQEISKIYTQLSQNSQELDYNELSINLQNILRRLMPVNYEEINRLIKKIEDTGKKLEDQHILMFVGPTGVGKSTTIQFLAGSKMKLQRIDDLNHIGFEINSKYQQLIEVETKPNSKSTTRYVTGVKIRFSDIEDSYSDGSIILCDTPGFEDCCGVEVDFVNGLGIYRAIRKCKSVRPVVLFSYKSLGDKLQGVKELVTIIAGMLTDMSKHLKCFTYIFTKFPDLEKDRINAMLKDFYKNMTEEDKANPQFKELVVDMIIQTSKDPIVLNPLVEKPGPLLDSIYRKQVIEYPEEAFTFSISSKSKIALEQQTSKHRKAIIIALKTSNYQLIEYKLNQLSRFEEVIQTDKITEIYSDCKKSIQKHLDDQYTSAINYFNKCMDVSNTLEQQDLDQYNTAMQEIEQAENVRKQFLTIECKSLKCYLQNIIQQCKMLNQYLEHNKNQILNSNCENSLKKLKLLSQYPDIEEYYQQGKAKLDQFVNSLCSNFKQQLKVLNYSICIEELQKLQLIKEHFSNHISEETISYQIESLKDDFMTFLNAVASQIQPILDQQQINQQAIQALNIAIENLQAASTQIMLSGSNILSKEKVDDILKIIIQRLFEYFQKIMAKIQISLKEDNEQKYIDIEQYLHEATLLRQIEQLEYKTGSLYHNQIEQICSQIKDFKRQTESNLERMQNGDSTDYKKIAKGLKIIKYIKWLDQYRPGIFEDIVSMAKEMIDNHFDELLRQIQKIQVDLENHDKLLEKSAKLKTLLEMRCLAEFSDNLEENLENQNKQYLEQNSIILKFIEKEYCLSNLQMEGVQSPRIDPYQVTLCLEYVMISSSCPLLQNLNSSQIKLNLEKYLKEYGIFIDKEISKCFYAIQSFKNQKDDDFLQLNISKIYQRFKELQSISYKQYKIGEEKYMNIAQILDQKITIFRNYSIDKGDEIDQCVKLRNIQQVIVMLKIIKALSQLDEFLPTKCLFNEIHKKYKDQFYEEIPKDQQAIMEAIQNFDYAKVGTLMVTFEANDFLIEKKFQSLKNNLNSNLELFIKELKDQAGFTRYEEKVTPEYMEILKTKLQKLESTKSSIQQYLLQEMNQKIDQCITSSVDVINTNLSEHLGNLELIIQDNNYQEANLQFKKLGHIFEKLDTQAKKEVLDKFELLKILLKTNLEVIKKKYREIQDLDDLRILNPKDLFSKLLRGQDNSSKYQDTMDEIKKYLRQKFLDKLDAIYKEQAPIHKKQQQVKKLEGLSRYLPEGLEKDVIECLHFKQEEMQDEEKDKSDSVQESINGKYNTQIVQIYEANKVNGQPQILKQIKEYVREEVKDFQKEISDKFSLFEQKKSTFQTILDVIKSFLEFRKVFIKHFSVELQFCHQEIQIKLAKLNKQNYIDLLKQFKSESLIIQNPINSSPLKYQAENGGAGPVRAGNSRHSNPNCAESSSNSDSEDCQPYIYEDNVSNIQSSQYSIEHVQIMNAFIEFKHEYGTLIYDIIPQFDSEIANAIQNISKTLTQNQQDFIMSVNKNDFKTIKLLLSQINRRSNIYLEFQQNQELYQRLQYTDLSNALKTCQSFQELTQIVLISIQELEINIIKLDFNKTPLKNQDERDKVFKQINQDLILIQNSMVLKNFISLNLLQLFNKCTQWLDGQVQSMNKRATDILKTEQLTEEYCKEFSYNFNILISISQHIKIKGNQYTQHTIKLKDQLFNIIDKIQKFTEGCTATPTVAMKLIELKCMSENIPELKKLINQRINNLLTNYKLAQGFSSLSQVGKVLNSMTEGKLILKEHPAFEGISLSIFNQKIQKHGIEYVLQNITGDQDISKKGLANRYETFKSDYEKIVNQYIDEQNQKIAKGLLKENGKINLEGLITQIKQQRQYQGKNVKLNLSNLHHLIAMIFALWTLQNMDHYFEAQGQSDQGSFLFTPHAAQVVAIFRILSVGDSNEILKNNLVQIGTGEGKSVTLGVASTILALLGFEVSCACYSEYLSKRDYESFFKLFEALDVEKQIHYGTFNKLCERIINKTGEIRKIVSQYISGEKIEHMNNQFNQDLPQILLIDEVDVFFCKDFYGNSYTPSATIYHQTISNLLDYIWNNKDNKINLNLNAIKTLPLFSDLCAKFKQWENLLIEVVKDLIYDVQSFETQDYIKNETQCLIGYKDQDSVSYSISYGYKTLFAYYKENSLNNKWQQSLDKYKSFKIVCGDFSFAEIPKEFKYIMGVTGTLKSLTKQEQEVIVDQYKISRNTYMPSVFGSNDLSFIPNQDCRYENTSDYLNSIYKEIQSRLVGKNQGTKRAVLVFFESIPKLEQFKLTPGYQQIKDYCEILTEETLIDDKLRIINSAALSGQITLLTKSFGRGTDFVARDETVSANGGLHVIQTFLSEELSEEIQIKGRTARQGGVGSFSLVLLESDLEKFLCSSTELNANKGRLYDYVHQKRLAYFNDQYENNKYAIKVASQKHIDTIKFLKAVKDNKQADAKEYLIQRNKGPAVVIKKTKTIILMDATGSMSGLLNKAKITVQVMFERAGKILQDNGIDSECVEMMFAAYRNYSSTEQDILEHSTWECKPDNLKGFMSKINVSGGIGPEAVEIGLWLVNQEIQKNQTELVSQVILIGDAPSNPEASVIQYRSRYQGESYWNKSKFGAATSYTKELQKIKPYGIPVHAFYVVEYAKPNFQEIATSTGGKCQFLDINSNEGAKLLTDQVTSTILEHVGKQNGQGTQLAEIYKKMYGNVKSYS